MLASHFRWHILPFAGHWYKPDMYPKLMKALRNESFEDDGDVVLSTDPEFLERVKSVLSDNWYCARITA